MQLFAFKLYGIFGQKRLIFLSEIYLYVSFYFLGVLPYSVSWAQISMCI